MAEVKGNSRLGRVLVNRGLISESQLEFALEEQGASGQRLGEVLLSKGWIDSNQLELALKRQLLIRKAGAMATAICAPLYSVPGFAATLVGKPVVAPVRTEAPLSVAHLPSGLIPMSELELGGVSAQGPYQLLGGFSPSLGYDAATADTQRQVDEREDEEDQEESIAYQLLDSVATVMGFGPLSSGIEADVSMEGFRRFEDVPMLSVLDDGGVRISTGFEVDRINVENIRVKGRSDPAIFGSIYMTDVVFDKGSSMTINAANARW